MYRASENTAPSKASQIAAGVIRTNPLNLLKKSSSSHLQFRPLSKRRWARPDREEGPLLEPGGCRGRLQRAPVDERPSKRSVRARPPGTHCEMRGDLQLSALRRVQDHDLELPRRSRLIFVERPERDQPPPPTRTVFALNDLSPGTPRHPSKLNLGKPVRLQIDEPRRRFWIPDFRREDSNPVSVSRVYEGGGPDPPGAPPLRA